MKKVLLIACVIPLISWTHADKKSYLENQVDSIARLKGSEVWVKGDTQIVNYRENNSLRSIMIIHSPIIMTKGKIVSDKKKEGISPIKTGIN